MGSKIALFISLNVLFMSDLAGASLRSAPGRRENTSKISYWVGERGGREFDENDEKKEGERQTCAG